MRNVAAGNEQQEQYWSGEEGAHWIHGRDRYDAMLDCFNHYLTDSGAIGSGKRVLDIGCGCGSSTLSAAACAGEGLVRGVDISGSMIDVARLRARGEANAQNVKFTVADAQIYPFEPQSFDVAISRFGVMFFVDPIAAFANIVRALDDDGRVAFLCWQGPLLNEWISVPARAASAITPLPEMHPGPGPFALADPTYLERVARSSGLADVQLAAVAETLTLGATVEEAAEFFRSTNVGRALFSAAGRAASATLEEALILALRPYEDSGGVRLRSSAWLMTGRRSGGE